MTVRLRVLCLGNDLLADDAFGHVVADRLLSELGGILKEASSAPGSAGAQTAVPSNKQGGEDTAPAAAIEVVKSSLAGLALLDELGDVARLIVIDSVQTGGAPPGTVYVLREGELKSPAGPSPHYLGILETLRLARYLGFPAPEEVTIVAVEAADCTTLGGTMHPDVQAAIPKVIQLVEDLRARTPP